MIVRKSREVKRIAGASAAALIFAALVFSGCAGRSGTIKDLSPSETAFLLQKAFQEITEKVIPVVVQINVIETKVQQLPEGEDFPFSPWHYGPFDPEAEIPEQREFRSQGIGSGVVVRKVDDNYYVLTNGHVLGDAQEAEIKISNEIYNGTIIGKDVRKDLALISFTTESGQIPVARLGDSDTLRVGDWVLAVGNPFGYESTVTSGIVSAIGRRGPTSNINNFIQTDAAINQGNSGGALVNLYGEVIGINTWISTPTGGNIGLGFSIPINNAKKAIDDFILYGAIRYGWLGVSIADLLPEVAEELSLEDKDGAFVYHVFLGSPADEAGIKPGDYIIKIGDEPIGGSDELVLIVGDLPPEESTRFILLRDGKEIEFDVFIGLRSDNETIAERGNMLWPGIGVVPLSDYLRNEISAPEEVPGVVVSEAEPGSFFQEMGVRFGDLITEINGRSVKNMQDFYQIINSVDRERLEITLFRGGAEVKLEK